MEHVHSKLLHTLRNAAQVNKDMTDLLMQAVSAIEGQKNAPRLFDGMVQIPCAVMMDPASQHNGWLFIPHCDGKWVTLTKVPKFSGQILEYWLDETKPAAWAESLSGS